MSGRYLLVLITRKEIHNESKRSARLLVVARHRFRRHRDANAGIDALSTEMSASFSTRAPL
jgi:hypothetical protein